MQGEQLQPMLQLVELHQAAVASSSSSSSTHVTRAARRMRWGATGL
jgi:hypothetical protein